MRHKIVRIGSWFFVMAVFMCCASTYVEAATTPPVWYLTDVRDVGLPSQNNNGYYFRDGKEYALIHPWVDNLTNIPVVAMGGIAYNNTNTFYSTSNNVTPSDKGLFTGYGILNAWEPYSYYNFKIDENWRIDIEDSTPSSLSGTNYWFIADRNQTASVELNLEIGKSTSTEFASASQTISADNQYLFDTQGNWGVATPFSTKWIHTRSMIRGGGRTSPYYNSTSININDLIISVVPSTTDVNEGDFKASGNSYAKIFLFCPVSYIPKGLTFGDIWPIGNVLTPHSTPEENAVNQFSGDKETIETVGEVFDNGIGQVTDIYTLGIGDNETTYIDLINTLFNQTFHWWLDIFGLMFLFGVLGIVVRRALHD